MSALPYYRRLARPLCGTVLSFLTMPSALAQLTNAPSPVLLPSSGSTALAAVRVLGALALVLAVFFGGLWIFRNWQRFQIRQGRAPKLAVFETKSLGPRHTLYVVGYEQERLLIAASPNGVSMLTSLPRGEADPQTSVAAPHSSTSANFGVLLQALTGKL